MKVLPFNGVVWRDQSDYPGFIVITRVRTVAIFMNYRALFKMKALGKHVEKTKAWIS